ncbi:hypothetical protein EYF80_032248 [Liparis tanakae]|uniref:Uncharacterized protein n=1 Tax=Liparis tanakae TaxID=230148 RepID=A0A4Z2GY42_9TELE|nr:hypothetical protein EYF80_032248 [Liparis tanakae]
MNLTPPTPSTPTTTNPTASMLTLERAAPLLRTQKAISGPFTAPGSILLPRAADDEPAETGGG